MPYFWGLWPWMVSSRNDHSLRWLRLWSQSSQKWLIFENRDYDRSPHKMIATLFLRIEIMITVLIKCIIYEDYDYVRSLHKNIMFLSLYMFAINIQKMSYIWVFVRTAIMITVLWPWSQSSQNALFLSFCMIAVLTRCPISESVLIELIACMNKMRSAKRSIPKQVLLVPVSTLPALQLPIS